MSAFTRFFHKIGALSLSISISLSEKACAGEFKLNKFIYLSIFFYLISCTPFSRILNKKPSKQLANKELFSSSNYRQLIKNLDSNLENILPQLIAIDSSRKGIFNNNNSLKSIQQIKNILDKCVKKQNITYKKKIVKPFEWKKTINNREYWLFGYRLGSGTKKNSNHKSC